MTSLEGFLKQPIGNPPRMTAGQKAIVLRGAQAALRSTLGDEGAMAPVEALEAALGAVPDDRSCLTCDYFRGGHCLEWAQDVPKAHQEAGCDRHQTDGCPF